MVDAAKIISDLEREKKELEDRENKCNARLLELGNAKNKSQKDNEEIEKLESELNQLLPEIMTKEHNYQNITSLGLLALSKQKLEDDIKKLVQEIKRLEGLKKWHEENKSESKESPEQQEKEINEKRESLEQLNAELEETHAFINFATEKEKRSKLPSKNVNADQDGDEIIAVPASYSSPYLSYIEIIDKSAVDGVVQRLLGKDGLKILNFTKDSERISSVPTDKVTVRVTYYNENATINAGSGGVIDKTHCPIVSIEDKNGTELRCKPSALKRASDELLYDIAKHEVETYLSKHPGPPRTLPISFVNKECAERLLMMICVYQKQCENDSAKKFNIHPHAGVPLPSKADVKTALEKHDKQSVPTTIFEIESTEPTELKSGPELKM